MVLTSPKGDKLAYVLQLHFDCTNNMAEYEALLHGLRLAKEMNIKRIRCFGDSDLVAQQVCRGVVTASSSSGKMSSGAIDD